MIPKSMIPKYLTCKEEDRFTPFKDFSKPQKDEVYIGALQMK